MKPELYPSESKIEEGEFLPSKEFPEQLKNGDLLHTYWTMQNGEIFTFCIQESIGGGFSLYGGLHGKIYPWQLQLADLSQILRGACVAKSFEKAEILLFEKMQDILDTIAVGSKKDSTIEEKRKAWSLVRHVETLYNSQLLSKSWFISRHGELIESVLEGRLSQDEKSAIALSFDASKIEKREALLRKTKKPRRSILLF